MVWWIPATRKYTTFFSLSTRIRFRTAGSGSPGLKHSTAFFKYWTWPKSSGTISICVFNEKILAGSENSEKPFEKEKFFRAMLMISLRMPFCELIISASLRSIVPFFSRV